MFATGAAVGALCPAAAASTLLSGAGGAADSVVPGAA